MRNRLPKSLENSPLIEAIFEIRFSSRLSAVGDILPGQLFGQFSKDFPDVVPLPAASVPRQIRDQNAEFRYQASHSLQGHRKAIQVGDRVISVSFLEYLGWTDFRNYVLNVLEFVNKTTLLDKIERFSFKYINLIPSPDTGNATSFLDMCLELMGETPIDRGFQLRLERDDDEFTTIIQIVATASVKNQAYGLDRTGLLVDVDTLYKGASMSPVDLDAEKLDACHKIVKKIFFSLLTDETLNSMKPEW